MLGIEGDLMIAARRIDQQLTDPYMPTAMADYEHDILISYRSGAPKSYICSHPE